MYIYIEKREQFDKVPKALLDVFGKPRFLMLFNLDGDKSLALASNTQVKSNMKQQGYYLQMPKHEENLLTQFKGEKLNISQN